MESKYKKIINESNEEEYAVGMDGRYYIGHDSIISIPDDVVLKEAYILCADIIEWRHSVTGDFAACTKEEGSPTLQRIRPNVEFGGRVAIIKCLHIHEWNNRVAGDFYADGTNLKNIGPDAEFGSFVGIEYCPHITEWKNTVAGALYADNSGLQTIDVSKIEGPIYIGHTPLAAKTGITRATTPEEKQHLANAITDMERG